MLQADEAPVEVAGVIDLCMAAEPDKRPTASEVYHMLSSAPHHNIKVITSRVTNISACLSSLMMLGTWIGCQTHLVLSLQACCSADFRQGPCRGGSWH